jgi:hypothetical protein
MFWQRFDNINNLLLPQGQEDEQVPLSTLLGHSDILVETKTENPRLLK